MSGVPYWFNERVNKPILIEGRETILRDAYCVGCRYHSPNSDELILVTDMGEFNTSDHKFELPPLTRKKPRNNRAPVRGPRSILGR